MMNLEPTPAPESPSLFDIEALEPSGSGDAPGQPGDVLPLEGLAVERLAVEEPASPPAEESPGPALDLPVLWAFGGFELAQAVNDTTERGEVELVEMIAAQPVRAAATQALEVAPTGALEPLLIAAPLLAGPAVAVRAAPAGRLRSGLILLVVVVSMATLLAAVVGVIVALIVLAVQSALG